MQALFYILFFFQMDADAAGLVGPDGQDGDAGQRGGAEDRSQDDESDGRLFDGFHVAVLLVVVTKSIIPQHTYTFEDERKTTPKTKKTEP